MAAVFSGLLVWSCTHQAIAGDPYWVQTEFEKIQSKLILYPVITNLNLQVTWAEKGKTKLRLDEAYIRLRGQLDVREWRHEVRGTGPIEIRVRSEDPKEAAAIANAVAEEYRKNGLARYKALTDIRWRAESGALDQKINTLESRAKQPDQLGNTNEIQMEIDNLRKEKKRLQVRFIDEYPSFRQWGNPIEIIDHAEPALKPIYPNKFMMAGAFFFGALSMVFGVRLLQQSRKARTGQGTESK